MPQYKSQLSSAILNHKEKVEEVCSLINILDGKIVKLRLPMPGPDCVVTRKELRTLKQQRGILYDYAYTLLLDAPLKQDTASTLP